MSTTKFGSVMALGLLSIGGCSANTSGSRMETCTALSTMAAPTAPKYPGTVFTIVLENHSRSQIIGDGAAPYITSLAHSYASAYGYHDAYVHPSEPNYLFMVTGENFDILDDDDPASHTIDSSSHIADQIEAAGLTWKSYQESMGDPCGLKSHGRYAAKHNPFVFFKDINGWDGTQMNPTQRCLDSVVDLSNLSLDIRNNTVPNYAFITPNLDNDMHDGSIGDGDKWLSKVIPQIQASDAYKNGGVIFLLWDEGGGYPAGDDPPFIVISEHAKKNFISYEDYDQSNYLQTVEVMLGVAKLPCDSERDAITSMDDLFPDSLQPPTATPSGSGDGSGSSALTAVL